MINQAPWRSYFLAVVGIGTNIAVIYGLLFSGTSNRPVADYEFPQRLNLGYGRAVSDQSAPFALSTLNKHQVENQEVFKSRQQYKYIQNKNKTEINIEINYLVGTRGDVPTYLLNYAAVAPEVLKTKQINQLRGIGYHVLFNHNNQAYLSSCISPRSLSNVTQEQFSHQRYQNDLRWQVAWDWIKGKASIRDRRCLWVLLSKPIDTHNPQASYQTLEIVWRDLYQWWLPNFPSLTEKLRTNSFNMSLSH